MKELRREYLTALLKGVAEMRRIASDPQEAARLLLDQASPRDRDDYRQETTDAVAWLKEFSQALEGKS